MSLKLDLLHTQVRFHNSRSHDLLVNQMMQVQLFSSQVAGEHVKVEEYLPGKLLQIVYWRPVDPPQQHYQLSS